MIVCSQNFSPKPKYLVATRHEITWMHSIRTGEGNYVEWRKFEWNRL